jgi:hypothetical protein
MAGLPDPRTLVATAQCARVMVRFLPRALAPAVFASRRRRWAHAFAALATALLATAAAASSLDPEAGVPPAAPTQTDPVALAAAVPLVPASDAEEEAAQPWRWSTNAGYSGGIYRWSLSRGSFDFGLRFETPARPGFGADSRLDATGPLVQTLPALSLGVRTIDAPAGSWLQRLSGTEGVPSSTSRVAIEWKPAESQLMFLRQGLGIRLSGDDRVTMRLRKGTLGIYMKREY